MQISNNIVEPVVTLKDRFFDLQGLSIYSAMAVSTLRDYIKSENLPAFKIKGKLLVRKSEFDHWVEAFRINKKQNLDNIVSEVMNSLKGEINEVA